VNRICILWMITLLNLNSIAYASEDSDQDGIEDDSDLCSDTPLGVSVWRSGEWIGCAEGQTRDTLRLADSDLRLNAHRGINRCEDEVIDHFDNHINTSSNCHSFALRIESATSDYRAMGRTDRGIRGEDMTTHHLVDRLNLCLSTTRRVAEIFDLMDRSGCNRYTPYYNYHGDRVPASASSSSEGGLYSPGVTYIRHGNIINGSDGSVFVNHGSITHGSNGETYISHGNITNGSDGSTFITHGSITNGTSGTCVTHGSITNC
jgi:hypothetical protein